MTGIIHYLHQSQLRLFKQQLLSKEVTTSITGKAQFGKNHHLSTLAVSYQNLTFNALLIFLTISHYDMWYSRCHFYKSIIHLLNHFGSGHKIKNKR